MKELRVGVISDAHVGSTVGISSPEVVLNKGTPREYVRHYSELQAEIYEGFTSAMAEMGRPDILVFNGDIVDGYNRNAHGIGVWSCCYDDQINESVRLFQPYLPRSGEVYGTMGSTYHVGDNICGDAEVVKRLGGKFSETWFLEVSGVKLNFSHFIGVSKNSRTKSNSVMAELSEAVYNKNYYGDIDVIVRSHAHYYVSTSYDSCTGVVTPALKARDDFIKRLGLAFAPRLGVAYIDCCNGDYNIEPILFKLSQKNYAEWVKVDI